MPESNPRGTYLVVARELRMKLNEPGVKRLPSEALLADEYGVSRNTIRRALKELESENLIASLPGSGWHVASGPIRPLLDKMVDLFSSEGLSVGDTYPSESKLCERFNVSRTAVRRALAQLEGRGLLATKHGTGRTILALPSALEKP
ncbi:GntR family transcriptional regulator [Streptomyces sp. NPDC057854]|uniref:GntR family transcriptional regulator n=1 Tax=unclassified Streptomyces TaxID=2593676 RepID=UPI00369098FC